jgi:hypothetical protein
MNNQNLNLQKMRLEERNLRQFEFQNNEENKLKQTRFEQLQKLRLDQLQNKIILKKN